MMMMMMIKHGPELQKNHGNLWEDIRRTAGLSYLVRLIPRMVKMSLYLPPTLTPEFSLLANSLSRTNPQ